jgi:hypothetical protein
MSNDRAWDQSRYAAAYVDLCDSARDMIKRGAPAEEIFSSLFTMLARPEMKGMLDFAALKPLPDEQRPAAGYERKIRGQKPGDLTFGELKGAKAEAAVDAVINIALGWRAGERP